MGREDKPAHMAADCRRELQSMGKEDLVVDFGKFSYRHNIQDSDGYLGECAVCGHQCPYYIRAFESASCEFVSHASRCKLELLRWEESRLKLYPEFPCLENRIILKREKDAILQKYKDFTGDYDGLDSKVYEQCMAQGIWTPKLFTRQPLVYQVADQNEERLVDGYQRFLRKHYAHIKEGPGYQPYAYSHLGDECRQCLRSIVRKLPRDYVEKITTASPKCLDEQLCEFKARCDAEWARSQVLKCSYCGRKSDGWNCCEAYARHMHWVNQPMSPSHPYFECPG